MAKPGRKGIYDEIMTDYIKEQIPKWVQESRSHKYIALSMGISPQLLSKWKREHEELRGLFQEGKALLLAEMEGILHKQARGFIVPLREYEVDEEGQIIPGTVRVKEKYQFSEMALRNTLASLDRETYSKESLEKLGKTVEETELVIFGGEDEL